MKQDPDPRPRKLAVKLRQMKHRSALLLRKTKGVKMRSPRRFNRSR